MTTGDIITAARDILNEASASFWTAAELRRFCTAAQRELDDLLFSIDKTKEITTTTEQSYALEADIRANAIYMVTFDGDRLKPASFRQMINLHGDQLFTHSGTPEYYWLQGNKIWLDYKPESGKTLKYWYKAYPADLTLDTSIPEIPTDSHSALIWGVVYRAAVKDENSNLIQVAKAEWEQAKLDALMRYRAGETFDEAGRMQIEIEPRWW